MGRCFYCLSERISVSMCLDCRTRLERAEAELKELKKQLERRRVNFFKRVNEKNRRLKRD